MISSRPYLIRALYDWIVDSALTPHLLVDAQAEGVEVPEQSVKEGKIVLNVAPQAVRGLSLGNELIEFSARFGGVSRQVSVPIAAVVAVYARENGQGMMFAAEDETTDQTGQNVSDNSGKGNPPGDRDQRNGPKGPHLTVVK